MKDIALYCKSYSRDFLRLKRLLESINQFNQDQIPFYISTPRSERALLVQIMGESGYAWVADEDIVAANPNASHEKYKSMPGGLSQAIIKSEFWRLRVAKNYLCLDSDCLFIRPFFKSDFMADGDLPFTVIHQNKEYFQLAIDRGELSVVSNLQAEAKRVQDLFGRSGPRFYCAPAPFIWSAKVWESLDREFLQPQKQSIWDLISRDYPETLIYGEALLRYQAIPLIAIEPLFRVYHYDWQYFLMKRLGETEEKLENTYLGVIYQSNWDIRGDFGPSNKTVLSRVWRATKKIIKKSQSKLFL